MLLNFLRNTCLLGLPSLLVSTSAIHFLTDWIAWSESLYIVALTANIGYFTNFIAIKMLFKPYYPTALGRQGLIPKNQPRLAKALSATLSDHFLANEHWHDYLEQANLLPKVINKAQKYCQNWIDTPKNQQSLQVGLQNYLKNNRSTTNELMEHFQRSLVNELADKLDPQLLLNQSFEWVETQFEERPREMEFLIEPIIRTVAENIPFISRKLIDTIDDHIEQQDTIRRGFAKAAKWSANINEDDIKKYLFRMVASFEFRQTLFDGLQTLVSEYKNRNADPDDNTPHIDFQKLVNDFISHQTQNFNLTDYLVQKLDDPDVSRWLCQTLSRALPNLFAWVNHQISQPTVQQMLTTQLVLLIEHIDLKEIIEEKAAKFSPQKMESIFHNMIKDQLVFIELLGALLGGLSGLALVDISYFTALTAILVSYYLIDLLLTKYKRNRQQTLVTKQT